jgi:membrane protein implicated in regulation of membrane protease activity
MSGRGLGERLPGRGRRLRRRGLAETRLHQGSARGYALAVILVVALVLALLFLPSPWSVVVISLAAVCEASFWGFGIRYSRRRRAVVGVQTMVGRLGETITALAPAGQVKVDGEIWEARAQAGAKAGETVRVTRVDGLTLEVEPA